MDNKKWYKRISTCFWFFLATFPLWYCFLSSVFVYFLHLDNNNSFNSLVFNEDGILSLGVSNFNATLKKLISQGRPLSNFTPAIIRSTFSSLFNRAFSIELNDFTYCFSNCFAWFVWVYIIELMVDFVVWLPKLIHSFMERWCID